MNVPFNPDKQVNKQDPNTPGYTFATSLYQIKMNELSEIIPRIREEVKIEMAKQPTPIESIQGDSTELFVSQKIDETVKNRNLDLINKMNSLPIETKGVGKNSVSGLTEKQMLETLQSIESSPATDSFPEFKKQYDPKGNFGFCFGRAMYYFNAAAARGLDRAAIRKVFLVGKMMPLGVMPLGTWQFHVALSVRGVDGQWYVLDNHLGLDHVVTVADWYDHYYRLLGASESFDIKLTNGSSAQARANALYLFFTDPIRVGMGGYAYNDDGYVEYDNNKNGKIEENEVFYNGYFKALRDYFSVPIPRCSSLRYQPVTDKTICESKQMKERFKLYNSKMNEWKKVFKQIEIDRAFNEMYRN